MLRMLLMAALIGACCRASAQRDEQVRSSVLVNHAYEVNSDLLYKVASNYELKLDVYRPRQAPHPVPVVMMIHGGGWINGSKEEYQLSALPFLGMGLAVVNVEYRLAKVAPAPAAVDDCLCALRWIALHAAQYNFDSGRVILAGTSAGGHLALATGMIPDSAGFGNDCAFLSDPKQPGPKVVAIINWFGITDVADLISGPNLRTYAVSWLGSQSGRQELAARLSPLTYVRAAGPPVFTIHGDADPVVPYSHAARLHQALTRAGVRNQLLTIPGGGHGSFTAEQDLKAFESIRSFLRDVGVDEGE